MVNLYFSPTFTRKITKMIFLCSFRHRCDGSAHIPTSAQQLKRLGSVSGFFFYFSMLTSSTGVRTLPSSGDS